MKNPIKLFYTLKYIERYENYIKSKRVLLAICLIITNLLGGLLYGYALGTIGGALISASQAFFPSNSSSSSSTTKNITSSVVSTTAFTAIPFQHDYHNLHELNYLLRHEDSQADNVWMVSSGQWSNFECILSVATDAMNNRKMVDFHYFGNCMQIKSTSKSGAYFFNREELSSTMNGNVTESTKASSGSSFNLDSTILQGLFASSIFIGGLFGCLFAMFTGSALGRKFSIILSCLISIIGSIGGAASYQYSTLIVFRCILGFGSGIVTAVSSVYVVELMPFPKYMGLLGSMFNLGISLGTCWGYAFGAIFVRSSEMWRAVHAFHNLFIIPLLVLVVFIIPESPMFIHGGHHDHEEELKQKHQKKLEENNNKEQQDGVPVTTTTNQSGANPTANSPVETESEEKKVQFATEDVKTVEETKTALPHICSAYVNDETMDDSETLEKEEDAADIEAQQDESPIEKESKSQQEETTENVIVNTTSMPQEESPKKNKTMSTLAACKRLFCSKVVKALIVACWGCFAMEWTGIQSSVMFLPSLIEAAGVSDLGQQLASLGVSVWQLFCIFPTMFLVDKFGRKPLMIFGFTVSFLTDLAEGFIFQFGENGTEYKVALALLFNCLYLIGFHVGVGSLGYVLAYEVFKGENEKVVVLGTSISTIAMWSTSIILSLFFIPVVVMTNQAVPWFIFAGFSLIGIFIYIFLLEETSPNIIAKRAIAKAKKDAEKKEKSIAGSENVQTKEEETGNSEKQIELTIQENEKKEE